MVAKLKLHPLPIFFTLTYLITWVYYHARGSVLIAGIFHAAADVTIPYLNVMTGPLQLFWLFLAVTVNAAGLIVVWQACRNLSRNPDAQALVYEGSTAVVR